MTAGETDEQPMTALDKPGGATLTEDPRSAVGAEGAAVLDGPFTTRQLLRLDQALRLADQQTGLTFSVYVGELTEPVREASERLHEQIENAAHAVLLAVSPNQRVLEIVTGNEARKRISDRDAKLAALSMAAAFAGGDLAGGVLAGIDQLATHAGRH
ncbi:DUF5130 family protein [Mangrovihabitans endophyticus]|uniref:TLP18.3, Psb32 and MOLO-1 founding protein of phosphatase n=1 Tax=Mangrovihabitans endophyticus TaxID=1751298 RepID=A0A8J3C368_9ACTN|nr:DUF5130 family protein [Mangrovihabitans endophyticus]GGL02818.1 hypothetical protein GCM10012284_41770 [Mangrovihabitans endophyticus]